MAVPASEHSTSGTAPEGILRLEGLDTFGSEHGPTARGAVDIRGVSCVNCSQIHGALLLLYAQVSPNVLAELLDGAMRAVHEAHNASVHQKLCTML